MPPDDNPAPTPPIPTVKVQVEGPPKPAPSNGAPSTPPAGYHFEDRNGEQWYVGSKPPTDGQRIWLPKERYDEQIQAERSKLTAAEQQIQALKPWEEKGPQYEQRLSQAQMNLAMVQSDYPMLRDPDVQGFLRERYDRHRADSGEDAKPFDEWLTAQAEAKSALTGHLFVKPEPEVPTEAKVLKTVQELLKSDSVTIEDLRKAIAPPSDDAPAQTEDERLVALLLEKLGGKTREPRPPGDDPDKHTHNPPHGTNISLTEAQVLRYIESGEYRNNPEVKARVDAWRTQQYGTSGTRMKRPG